MTIRELTVRELLDMYEWEIRRNHYDPCDDNEKQPFDRHELRDEIKRRLGG